MKTKEGLKKVKILKFIVDELSGVDKPAQSPALAVMTKRADNEDPPEVPLNLEEVQMSVELTKRVEELDEQVKDLNAKLEKADKLLELNDSQREFRKNLSERESEEFLAMDSETRDATIQKAAEADEEVTVGDITMKKSILGDEAFEIVKKQASDLEKANKEAAEATAKVVEERLNKRADELAHLPGTNDAKVALLKSVDSIEDETMRNSVLEVVKANNKDMSKAFEEVSHQSAEDRVASDQLEDMAKGVAGKDKISYEEAFTKVLGTAEGVALYEETQK